MDFAREKGLTGIEGNRIGITGRKNVNDMIGLSHRTLNRMGVKLT